MSEIDLNLNDERYIKKCTDCVYRDRYWKEDPCKLCYDNEYILGWHYYWKPRSKK